MCDIMNKLIKDNIKDTLIETAINLLALGTVSKEDIAKGTGLTLDEVKELAEEMESVKA